MCMHVWAALAHAFLNIVAGNLVIFLISDKRRAIEPRVCLLLLLSRRLRSRSWGVCLFCLISFHRAWKFSCLAFWEIRSVLFGRQVSQVPECCLLKALYRLHRLLGKCRAIGRPVKSSYAITHSAVNAPHSLWSTMRSSNCDQWPRNCMRWPWISSANCQLLNSVKLTLMLKCKYIKLKLLNQLYSLLFLFYLGHCFLSIINQYSFIYNILLIIKAGISFGLTMFSSGNTAGYRSAYSSCIPEKKLIMYFVPAEDGSCVPK